MRGFTDKNCWFKDFLKMEWKWSLESKAFQVVVLELRLCKQKYNKIFC